VELVNSVALVNIVGLAEVVVNQSMAQIKIPSSNIYLLPQQDKNKQMAKTKSSKNNTHRKIRGGYNANETVSINSTLKISPRKSSKSKSYKKKIKKQHKK